MPQLLETSTPSVPIADDNAAFEQEYAQLQALIDQQQFRTACDLGKELITTHPDIPKAHTMYAIAARMAGNLPLAIDQLKHAVTLVPDNVQYHMNLYNVCASEKLYHEAWNCLETLHILAPEDISIRIAKGEILQRLALFDESIDALEAALELDLSNIRIYELIAAAQLRCHNYDKVLKTAQQLEAINADAAALLLPAAVAQYHRGNLEEAQTRLQHIIIQERHNSHRLSGAYYWLGKIQEKQEDYDAAFASFATGQSIAQKHASNRPQSPQDNMFDHYLAINTEWAIQKSSVNWQFSSNDTKQPLFIVGSPRSGSTLVEQILASHTNMVTLSEEPVVLKTLDHLTHLARDQHITYPDILNCLDETALQQARDVYLNEAHHCLDATQQPYQPNTLMVDKHPFNIVHLNLIVRLFPQAKIVVTIRDPRDTCLSCLVQPFDYNTAMKHYYTLHDTVHIYARMMDLYLKYKTTLSLHIFELKYEELVTQPEPTIHALCEFAGEDWDDNMLSYYEKKNQKHYNTPSFDAVTKPVYTDAIDKWKHYRQHFEPYLTTLKPYIETFGYHYE